MKRIISVIFLIAVLCLGFAVNAYATDEILTISEDYQTVQLGDTTFTRTNTNSVVFYGTYELPIKPTLTPKQAQELGDCTFYMDESSNLLEAEFYYRDGSCLTVGYVTEELKQTIDEVSSNNDLELMVDFEWPYENSVSTTVNDLMGAPKVLSGETLAWSEHFNVYLCLKQDTQFIRRGYVLEEGGRFYYVDIQENGLDCLPYWSPSEYDSVNAYVITDPELLSQLEDAIDARNTVNDVFTDSSFTNSLSTVLMSLLFGLFPAAIFVLTLILSIRSKGYYRLIWGITASFAAAVLLTYIGFVILVLMI